MDDELREIYSEDISIFRQFSLIHSADASAFAERISIGEGSRSAGEYESLLRERAVRLAEFESRLKEAWPELSLQERINITRSLEGLLRSQAVLLYHFQSQLKEKYCLFSAKDKKKFLHSLDDLLDRESDLLQGFEDFLHQLQDAPQECQMEFLASFEDLIRREAILLDIYKDFLKVNCNVLKIAKSVNGCGYYRSCQNITYTYIIKNTCNCTVNEIKIIDSRLGVIVEGISLGPYEKRSFNKSTILDYPPRTEVCNTARVWGIDPNDFTIMRESNEVCIRMAAPARNQDAIEIGNQKTVAVASDPATAENSIVIKKNQLGKCCSNKDCANMMAIRVGDQLAAAYRSSRASSSIKIVSNQQ